MRLKLILTVILGIFLFSALQAQSQSYQVIVNSSNPISSMTKDEVSKLFLKKSTKWNDGQKALPIDLIEDAGARKAFCKEIHGKTVAAIKAYWQKKIFSGRAVPPPEKVSDAEVIAYVKQNPEAIGYISVKANTNQVKVVTIND